MSTEIKQKIENLNKLEAMYRNHKSNFENKLSVMRITHRSKEARLKELKKTAWFFGISILICLVVGIANIYTNVFC